jgi:hypothetical protein
MALKKEAYKALESIVSPEYITQDPVITETYTQFCYFKDIPSVEAGVKRPGCVILPVTTDEVQRIVKVCNRYKLAFVPASTFYDSHCIPKTTDTVFVDLKRMNKLEIDEKNLYAIVESGVTISQLQAELMDRGMYTMTPGGGVQASVLANTLTAGMGPIMYKTGLAERRTLALEWVMPDGELLKTGSLSSGKDYFWGEGPGPDLRALVRGFIGWSGAMGIVTKMAVKVYPFIPERPEPIGISPDSGLALPEKWIKWFNIVFPSMEKVVEVMYEIPKSGIAAAVMRVPILWRYRAKAKSKQHFWEIWGKAGEELKQRFPWIMRVLLIGFTSQKQVEYEERVLKDIIEEFGGTVREARPIDESWLQNADAVGMWWQTGSYISSRISYDTLDHSVESGKATMELKKKYTPPLIDEYDDPGWYHMSDLGHLGYNEFLVNWNLEPEDRKIGEEFTPETRNVGGDFLMTTAKQDMDMRYYHGWQGWGVPYEFTGPAYMNYHIRLRDIRKVFDPNNVSDARKRFVYDD